MRFPHKFMFYFFILLSFCLFCSSGTAQLLETIQIDRITIEPEYRVLLDSILIFKNTFYDSINIRDYIAKMDSLIEISKRNIFINDENPWEKTPENFSIYTKNNIHLLYTINKMDSLYIHSFSISRFGYLTTPFALYIIALFCERTGFNIPPTIGVSLTPVYHSRWLLTKAQHDSFLIRVKNRNAPWEESARRALQKRYLTKIEVFDPLYNCSW